MSTISPYQVDSQLPLIPRAKAAGLKLFVPSEYGIKLAKNFLAGKQMVRKKLKAENLPYTLFFSGFFADLFHIINKYNYAEGHIRVVGEGNTAFSLTSRLDIARFIAQALIVGSATDLEWSELAFEGSRKTPLEIKAIRRRS